MVYLSTEAAVKLQQEYNNTLRRKASKLYLYGDELQATNYHQGKGFEITEN